MTQISIKNTMAEVEKFKSAIPRVRDILRASSITGMDSMRHVCFYLLSRYITDKNVERLNIPKKLSWENIFIKAFEDEDIALQLFKHDLIDQFDKLFGTQQFSFEMKSGVKHKEILEIFNGISMEGIDLHMDILGYVYEQHLKTGSSAARDLGQFFTDRFICEYMVKICEPKFKLDGIPESVCDPTMGTGGFLTAYLKHFKNVDWSKYQTQVHGVDHDAKVAGVSRLNMFMESGGEIFKHLHTADSLHGGLNPTTYDIILANMPFGLKGLKYKDVHQSIKTLALDGTKSEPLFLQLMMVSLNKGGRCAVVVPDGMLVNNSKCHNGTRKYLLENFELKRVIKMKGKFFMNTGIQPSIIFFENSGKKTEKVEFWDVERDDKGNFSEKVVVSVPIEKFDESYSLQPEKYIQIKKSDYNSKINVNSFEELFNIEKGSLQSSKNSEGEYTFITASDDFKTHKKYTHECECVLIVGGSEGSLAKAHYFNGKFIASDLMYILTLKDEYTNKLSYKYIWYYLRHIRESIISNNLICMGTTKRAISKDRCGSIKLAFPSLELQTQIVEELDAIYESKQNASKMIESLKKQMKSTVKSIEYKRYDDKKIIEVFDVVSGKGNQNRDDKFNIPYYDSNGIIGYVEKELYDGEYIITARNLSIGAVHYVSGKYYPSDHTINMTSKDQNIYSNKFFFYWLKFNNQILINMSSGIKPGIRKSDVCEIKIPVPPLEVQRSIVERLDKLQEQITCLEQIESQADENAKFILNGYLGS